MKKSRPFRAVLLTMGLLALPLHAADPAPANLLENGGFENGEVDWRIVNTPDVFAEATGAAARSGRLGFSIADHSDTTFARAMSPDLPTVPGRVYTVKFWARTRSPGTYGGISVRFLTKDREIAGDTTTLHIQAVNTGGEWKPFSLTVSAPAGAATISVWPHTYSRQEGVLDFDDIELHEGGSTSAVLPSTAAAPADNTPGAAPAPIKIVGAKGLCIVIKADDLRAAPGGVHPRWAKFASFLRERGIKSGIGIITSSLEADNPAYFAWIKDHHASGLVEFWHHGHDHRQWKEAGANVYEFKGPSYEQQRDHLARGQQLAREHLGFAFTTFGAPFNVTDAATARALTEDHDLTVWLYGDKTAPAGKTVLDRDWGVNIENPIFVPSLEKFAAGYAATSAKRRYYVIQGHPAQWDDARFAAFTRIIDFLVAHEARFVTPTELAALLEP